MKIPFLLMLLTPLPVLAVDGAPLNQLQVRPIKEEALNKDKTMVTDKGVAAALKQARCVPHTNEAGKPEGYRCFEIEKGSLYDQAGMENGDVICGIDGRPVNTPAEAFAMLATMQTKKDYALCVKRRGKQITLHPKAAAPVGAKKPLKPGTKSPRKPVPTPATKKVKP